MLIYMIVTLEPPMLVIYMVHLAIDLFVGGIAVDIVIPVTNGEISLTIIEPYVHDVVSIKLFTIHLAEDYVVFFKDILVRHWLVIAQVAAVYIWPQRPPTASEGDTTTALQMPLRQLTSFLPPGQLSVVLFILSPILTWIDVQWNRIWIQVQLTRQGCYSDKRNRSSWLRDVWGRVLTSPLEPFLCRRF